MIKPSSNKDWENQIKKYLKDKPVSDFIHEIAPGITYQPFASPTNTALYEAPLISMSRATKGVSFSPDINNQELLNALAFGAESIELTIYEDTDLDTLLNNVRLDYITPVFNIKDKKATDKLQSYLNSNYKVDQIDRAFVNQIDFHSHTIKTTYEVLNTQESDTIQEMVDLCKGLYQNKNKNIGLVLNISKDFFLEIARLRALKILIANISRDVAIDVEYNVIGKLKSEVFIDDHNNNLIHQTTAALSAIIGGIDLLQLAQWQNTNSNYSRLSLHIQNILDLESNIHRYQDVMGGSYFIEDLTDKIATTVWDRL